MREKGKCLLYLLRSMISVPPNLFSCSVDVLWGDVSGSLLLGKCHTLGNLIKERHLSCFSSSSR